MKVQIFLDSQELEITDNIALPLNRTFSSLTNPTEIHVDFSKSISIPATQHNNRILGTAYRLDQIYNTQIPLGLDPLKRIPMRLVYNGSTVLEGYAKYVSSKIINGSAYYNMNLYGVIGDVIKKLKSVVLSADKLSDEQLNESDGGMKYILDDGVVYYNNLIDKDLVKKCWEYDGSPLSGGYYPWDVYGFAPAYRGLYDDFESNSIIGLESVTVSDGTAKDATEVLKQEWITNMVSNGTAQAKAEERANAIDFQSIIGSGLNEHALRQFRSYEQKPYIYFCRLMDMYQKKCKELSDYEIVLDKKWFNANNPYWTRLCYMFDYLSGRGINTDNTTPFSGYSNGNFTSAGGAGNLRYCVRTVEFTNFSDTVTKAGQIRIAPFNLQIVNKKRANSEDPLYVGMDDKNSVIYLSPKAHILVAITFTNDNGDSKAFYYWGAENKDNVTPVSITYNDSNFRPIYNETVIDKTDGVATLIGTTTLPIPALDLGSFDTAGLKCTISTTVMHPMNVNANDTYKASFVYRYFLPKGNRNIYSCFWTNINDANHTVVIPNTEMYSNWRYTTNCHISELYTNEKPLFDVILEYTKMFGLLWKPDYENRKIHILTRQSYFNDYQIVDWTSKFDGSKDCIIEPCSFNSKFVDFNYDSVDGFRYKGYKNKYGVEYGGKRLNTKYDFDTKTTKLFEGMHSSSVSTKGYTDIDDLINWDTTSKIPQSKTEIDFIDCEDTSQEKSVVMNNWFFRGDNFTTSKSYFLSDVSAKEKSDGKYYWIYGPHGMFEEDKPVIKINTLPKFSITYNTADDYTINGRTIGCLFNCPNEDFTEKKDVTSAQGNYIYDLCWKDFIQERYNSNNKKVTAYFNLSMVDFQSFNFNTFVLFNNQLFVVNKIFDFNPNSNTTTKVELVQVSDINNYIGREQLFPIISTNVSALNLTGDTDTITINARCYPTPDDYYFVHDDESLITDDRNIEIDDVELMETEVGYTILYYGWSGQKYTGKFVIKSGDETHEIPIEIN